MPDDLDLFGNLTGLYELNINLNKITFLPKSIGMCTSLKILKAEVNLLKTLPDSFSKLLNLSICEMNENEFEAVPEVIGQLKGLTRLKLNSNKLQYLSASLGKCINMESLWLSGNQITLLPPEFMNLIKLKEIFLSGNPLKSPSHEIVSKGIDHIIRDCKERYKIEVRGRQPPPMSFLRIGIMEEVFIVEPKYDSNLKDRIEEARSTGTLHLNWLGLRELPRMVLSLTNLIELRCIYVCMYVCIYV